MTTYRDAGVDLKTYDRAIDRVLRMIERTHGREVLPLPDGFAGLFALDNRRVLVGCTDGVGTKVKIAAAVGRHRGVGIDLVAMSVNDLICTGARPLFFLDYVAMGKLDRAALHEILEGVVDGCRQSGAALLGGETAEMPGVYTPGEYDLAGFAVGVVDRAKIIRGDRVRPGDAVIGLPSSGVHSNGFSLVRKALGERRCRALAAELLEPTRIYVRPVLEAIRKHDVRSVAHITGGGLEANIARVIPKNCDVVIHRSAWKVPPIFDKIQRAGRVPDDEMFRVFNMGVGMVMIGKLPGPRIGEVVRGRGRVRILPD